eukprot:6362923-Pyramimonas_sp.AAC.1
MHRHPSGGGYDANVRRPQIRRRSSGRPAPWLEQSGRPHSRGPPCELGVALDESFEPPRNQEPVELV